MGLIYNRIDNDNWNDKDAFILIAHSPLILKCLETRPNHNTEIELHSLLFARRAWVG